MSNPGRDQRTLVTFAVAEQQYAMAAACIEQIIPLPELICPPQAPALLLGFLHLSEVMVPVIRLHRLWQFPETPLGLWTPLIVVNEGERRMALLVERVDQVVNVDGDDVLPVPVDHVLNECVEGMFRSPTGPVLILVPQRLLLQQEAEMIAELQEQLRQRLGEPAGAPT